MNPLQLSSQITDRNVLTNNVGEIQYQTETTRSFLSDHNAQILTFLFHTEVAENK